MTMTKKDEAWHDLRFIKGVLQMFAGCLRSREANNLGDPDDTQNWAIVCDEADEKLEHVYGLIDELEEPEAGKEVQA